MKFFLGMIVGVSLALSTAALGYYSSYTDLVELDAGDLEEIVKDAVEEVLEDCEVEGDGDIYCR